MKKRFKKHLPALIITVLAGALFYIEYNAVPSWTRWEPLAMQNPFFVAMGKWGIRFLLISLAMSPLYTLTGWRIANKIRKPTGLAAFGFVTVHMYIHVSHRFTYLRDIEFLNRDSFIGIFSEPQYILYGFLAYVILSLLAITSIKPTMKFMGRFWKPLHRLVYVAGILGITHALIAATSGKRAGLGGAQSAEELRIYLYILIPLLIMRIPIVKYWLQELLPFAPDPKRKRKRKEKPKRTFDDAIAVES